MAANPKIGSLRWPVDLYKRTMQPDDLSGVTETLAFIQRVHVDIAPISLQSASGMLTIMGEGEQVETPVTHRCFMRWHPYQLISNFNVMIRNTMLPDRSTLTETYRIRRMHELEGRKRYLVLDVELESYKINDGDDNEPSVIPRKLWPVGIQGCAHVGKFDLSVDLTGGA